MISGQQGASRTKYSGILMLLCVPVLASCSGGDSFSGGGIPLGPSKEEISGVVVQSANLNQPVTGATATLTASDGSVQTDTTDSTGTYDFRSVTPGNGTLQIVPPTGTGLEPQTVPADVTPDSISSGAVALPPLQGTGQVTGIIVSPTSLLLHPGDKVTVTATLQGQNVPITLHPSLVVTGGVGHILPKGDFIGTRAGSGTLVAIFQNQSTSIPVTVQQPGQGR